VSEHIVHQLATVVTEIQNVFCTCVNDWIIWLNAPEELLEEELEETFVVWVYPDHVEVKESDAELVRNLLRE